MKQIAVLTSGGDSPGMNAALRAVTRSAISKGWNVFGVKHGFQGLVDDNYILLGARDVSGIIQHGGTILGSARCLEFETDAGQIKALRILNQHGVDGLVVIGGSGSQQGSNALAKRGFPVVGVASTIDNDLVGSDITIGVDTAMNIALESIDRLKTTASSHHRAFLVEVMGRGCGYLALMVGIAGGAEAVVIPEREIEPEKVAEIISESYRKGKSHAIIIVAEGAKYNANRLAEFCEQHSEELGFKLRTTTLGHVQRGGNPTAFDRILASRLGAAAVDCLEEGKHGVLCGWVNSQIKVTPLAEVAGKKKEIDLKLLELADKLD